MTILSFLRVILDIVGAITLILVAALYVVARLDQGEFDPKKSDYISSEDS